MEKSTNTSKGFTLIEVLLIIAIVGILALVAIPSIRGALDKGGEESYNNDKNTIWTTVATFWSDIHQGPCNNGGVWRWGDIDGLPPDHYFPTAIGKASDIQLFNGITNQGNPILYIDANGDNVYNLGEEVIDEDIKLAAVWMGLLVNASKDIANPGDEHPGTAATITGENSLYLVEYPRSSSAKYNGNLWSDKGSYTWIIGKGGRLHACYKVDNKWYTGFNGFYP